MDHLIIKPIPVPKTGIVKKLRLDIVPNDAEIYIEPRMWPRQKQNPKWRIEVTNLDARHDPETLVRIREACEQIARIQIAKWLRHVAPFLTIETVSWHELVRFATERPRKVLSPYHNKRRRRTKRLTEDVD